MARYKMRQKLFSLGEDFTIQDDAGTPMFEVDGKVFSIRERSELKDMRGNVVATIRGRLASIRAKMDIVREGEVVATITKALFAPLHDTFEVEMANGDHLHIDGSILEHEYTIRRDGTTLAQISKRWFSVTETYGIDVVPGEDDAMILAIAVALDEMAHDEHRG